MSVGIYDADIMKYGAMGLNLEVMKISAFYKKKGEIVRLCKDFDLSRHSTMVYIKDYNDYDFPECLFTKEEIIRGGLAFTNNKYEPPIDGIDLIRPDTSIYDTAFIQKIFNSNQVNTSSLRMMLNARHCRLSKNGISIMPNYRWQIGPLDDRTLCIMLHDYDLVSIEGAFEELMQLYETSHRKDKLRFASKFPLNCYNSEQFQKWSALPATDVYCTLKYNGLLDDKTFSDYITRSRIGEEAHYFEYYLTPPGTDESNFIRNGLPQFLRQCAFLRSNKVKILPTYDEGFFTDKRWNKVLDIIIRYGTEAATTTYSYIAWTMAKDFTLAEYAKKIAKTPDWKIELYKIPNINDVREAFVFVRENHPELFSMFYNTSYNSMGGQL